MTITLLTTYTTAAGTPSPPYNSTDVHQVSVPAHVPLETGDRIKNEWSGVSLVQYKMAVVIDNGSGLMKVGLAGDDEPKAIFPTVVSKPDASLVGAAALATGTDVSCPLQGGVVTDWDAMEAVWRHALLQTGGARDLPMLLTEAAKNPTDNREKMTQLMFEKFSVPSLFVSVQPVLSLYATGRRTGMVVEVGDGATQVVPVFAGFAVTEGISRSDLAGAKVTEYIRTALKLSNLEVARGIKETLCYLTAEPEVEMAKDIGEEYALPDGTTVKVGVERVKAPELLFTPSLGGFDNDSLQKMMAASLAKCEIDTRKDLAGSTVLAGGSSMFGGMRDRLAAAIPGNVKIVAPAIDRKCMAWIGGSILASLDSFSTMWLTKAEYEEGGVAALQKFP